MRVLSTFVAVEVATLVAGCGTDPQDMPLGKAHETCKGEVDDALDEDSEFKDTKFASLEDEGRSLSIGAPSVEEDGEVGELTSDLYSAVTATLTACVLEDLDGPDSILRKMESTTAMMGRQSDDWDEYEVTWSYHPDNGFDATFEQVDD